MTTGRPVLATDEHGRRPSVADDSVSYGLTLVGPGVMAQPLVAAEVARTAEVLGFHAIWVPEHIIVPTKIESRYPYSADGNLPAGGEELDSPDPFVWLAFVAAHTARIRLATGVLVLPQRDPFVVAKQVATLDVLSGGRIDLGVGVGWMREEFEQLGVEFETRGRRANEQIELLRRLWSEAPTSYTGDLVACDAVSSLPHPVQPGGVPIIVGGDSPAAARRAGRLGDGWFPGVVDPDHLIPLVRLVRSSALDAGRDPDAIRLCAGHPGDPTALARLIQLGFRHFTVGVGERRIREDGVDATLARLADRIELT